MNQKEKAALIPLSIGAIFLTVFGIIQFWRWASTRPTVKYCTNWTRAVSIKPTNSDNGKYSDEQYIVKYEDGSIDGQDQGKIPFARCTSSVKADESTANPKWKTYNYYGVDWED